MHKEKKNQLPYHTISFLYTNCIRNQLTYAKIIRTFVPANKRIMSKRNKKNTKKWIIIAIVIIALIGGNSLRTFTDNINKKIIQEVNKQVEAVGMEIPTLSTDKQGQIIQHTGYTLSYSNQMRTPQWVAWELTKAETRGEEERSSEFQTDPYVIGTKVETYDYSRSGYDRGHMAPAGDMKWDKQAMQESFYMSNICPQDHNLNKGDWNDLEIKTREWARRYGKAYVVCGPIYQKGKKIKYIGNNRVAVPHAFFKAILIYQKNKPMTMGFYFENKAGHQSLEDYLVSIDELETMTDMDFFSLLPDEIEDDIEKKVVDKLP